MNAGCVRWNCGEYSTVHAIRYASSGVRAPLPSSAALVGGVRGHAVIAARRRRREHQSRDTLGMVDDQMLRDEPAHGGAEHRGGLDIGGIKNGDGVERHVRQRDRATVAGVAEPAGIERDHTMPAAQVRRDRIEDACSAPQVPG